MKRPIKFFIAATLLVGATIWIYQDSTTLTITGIVQKKNSKIRATRNLSDEELKVVVRTMRQQHAQTQDPQKLIELGAKFFFDTDFSNNGRVACATCHIPGKSFTDSKQTAEGIAKTTMNTPTLINNYAGEWFFWNGRADSLEAQALGPVENPKEHGFSRSKVLGRISTKYKKEYEALFGRLPIVSSDLLELPPPAGRHSQISNAVAAYALATLGSDTLQKNILSQAQKLAIQPIDVLKTMASGETEPPSSFDKIPEPDRQAINGVFANFGKAIAAFERTIRTDDSPFDSFVDRLSNGKPMLESLSKDFGEAELRGLRLFTGRGNCTLCHQGSNFTDEQFHNIGMMALTSETIDLGRSQGLLDARDSEFNCKGPYLKQETPKESCRELDFIETESAEAVGAFKTPTLRNLKDTAPYGHDGRFPTINSILLHYNHLAVPPAVGHIEESLAPLEFNEQELRDLESFLLSLSGPVSYFRGK